MDPNATLAVILSSDSSDVERREAARDLNAWLERGGFRPDIMSHPATDAWMSGDRYGVVTRVGRLYVHVRMRPSGRVRRFTFGNVLPMNGTWSA